MTETKKRTIIDFHTHPDFCGYGFEKAIENMDKFGIDQALLLTWEAPKEDFSPVFLPGMPSCLRSSDVGISFDRCLAYKERAPERFILGYAPDPRKPHAIDRLQAAIDLFDVRVCGEFKLRMMYDNLDAIEFFQFCGERNLPVILHFDYLHQALTNELQPTYDKRYYWYGGGIDALERVLQQCPETIFLGHASGFWSHISGDDRYDKELYPSGGIRSGGRLPELLRKYPNLYCDISADSGCNALRRDRAFAKEFLVEFQDRVLYGRDRFDNVHQELLNSLDLPTAVLEKIYIGNAWKLVLHEKKESMQERKLVRKEKNNETTCGRNRDVR